jgi:hypothetical protein
LVGYLFVFDGFLGVFDFFFLVVVVGELRWIPVVVWSCVGAEKARKSHTWIL